MEQRNSSQPTANYEFEAVKNCLQQLGHVYPSGARRQWGFTVYRTVYPPKHSNDDSTGPALGDSALDKNQKTSTIPSPPDWDNLFHALITKIYARARASVLNPITDSTLRNEPPATGNEEWTAACQELASLFHLEVKDDRTMFEGKTTQQVREIAQSEWAVQKAAADAALEGRVDPQSKFDDYDYQYDEIMSHAHAYKTQVFLYVDEQVLLQFRDTTAAAADFEPWIKVIEVDYEPRRYRGNKRYGQPQYYFGTMAAEIGCLASLWSDLDGQGLSNVAVPLRVPVNGDGEVDDGVVIVPVPVWDGTGGSGNYKLSVRARVSLKNGSLEFV